MKNKGIHRSTFLPGEQAILEHAAWMLDLANDTIMIRNLSDEIIYWNKGAERLYGWSKKEALGQYVHDFLHTVFPAPFEQVFKEFLAEGHWDGTLVHTKKDGTTIIVSSRWTLQRDEHGHPAVYLEINNDITARVRVEQELQQTHAELEKRVAERTLELQKTNEMLLDQIRERKNVEEALKRLSRKLISAQEDERRRISRDLHDDLGQVLTYISLDLERALITLDDAKKNELIKKVLETNRDAHRRLRELSSLLRPSVLDDVGIEAAIHTYVSEFAQTTGVHTNLEVQCAAQEIPEDSATGVYRILQEALTNVSKHSQAHTVSIVLHSSAEEVLLTVEDDGIGFDMISIDSIQGNGISGMKERAELLGGTFKMNSISGRGTKISVSFPMRGIEL